MHQGPEECIPVRGVQCTVIKPEIELAMSGSVNESQKFPEIAQTGNCETGTDTSGSKQPTWDSMVTMKRIDDLERALTDLVQGLCTDVRDKQLSEALADLRADKVDAQSMKIKLEASNKKCSDLKNQLTSHQCQTKCECTDKISAAMAQQLQAEEEAQSEKDKAQKCQDNIVSLQQQITENVRELELIREELIKEKEHSNTLAAQLQKTEKKLQDAKDQCRELELQCEADNDQDRSVWQHVPQNTVKVKGKDNPMSDFHGCTIKAFGTTFNSLEHALQYKKLFDHNLVRKAEELRNIQCPISVKQKAAEALGRSENINWEDKCEHTMRMLLDIKRESCPDFVTELKASQGREILHNVASPEWGTGVDGKGKNRFGKLLMKVRDEWFGGASGNQGEAAVCHEEKPSVLIIGNSLTRNIHADKLSRDFATTISKAATIHAAKEAIESLTGAPKAIVFQLTTDDVKTQEAARVVTSYKNLVHTTRQKFSETRVIVSSAPYMENGSEQSVRTALVNAALLEAFHNSEVTYLSNRNVSSFATDSIHLSRTGTSQLARNMKAAINKVLGITATSRHHSLPRRPLPTQQLDQQPPTSMRGFHGMRQRQYRPRNNRFDWGRETRSYPRQPWQ